MIDNVIPAHPLGYPEFIADTLVHRASRQAMCVTDASWGLHGGLFMR